MENWNNEACRQSKTFKGARCIFDCSSKDSPVDEIKCEYDPKEYNAKTYPIGTFTPITDIKANFKPLHSRKPNLFRKCLEKELRPNVLVECLVQPKNMTESDNPGAFYTGSPYTDDNTIKTPQNGTYRGATSKCKIFTVGDYGKKYSFDLESDPSLDEYFSEKKTQSDFLLDNDKASRKYIDYQERGDKYKNPLDYYESNYNNDEKQMMKLFLKAPEPPRPTELPKLPQEVKCESPDGSLQFYGLIAGSIALTFVGIFSILRLCRVMRKSKKSVDKKPQEVGKDNEYAPLIEDNEQNSEEKVDIDTKLVLL